LKPTLPALKLTEELAAEEEIDLNGLNRKAATGQLIGQ
jgi:hypothetical protein